MEKLQLSSTNGQTQAVPEPMSKTPVTVSRGLQSEVNSLTQQIRDKRIELHQSQVEIERLNKLVEELQLEKNELINELDEARVRLNNALAAEEESQQERANLLNIDFEKQQQIEQLQTVIEQLSAKSEEISGAQMEHVKQRYELAEANLAELKVMLDQRENELRRAQDMYLEICREKNNLQDTLKAELDAEYEAQLKECVDRAIKEHTLTADVQFKLQLDEKLS